MSANSSNSGNSGNFRKRQAILCGVSNYSRIMGNPLPTVEQEIPAIADVLSNKLHEGYRYKVTPLLNENVTLDDLPTIFAPYKQDSPTDELLFYFSGHGTIYNGEPYFVTYGAESDNPGIKLSDLATQINSLHLGIKQIFLILDFCHSGGILEAINLDSINPSLSQTISQRTAILTATRKHQLGETKNQFGKSFADYFVEALTNTLPDKNGHISFGRLALYVSEQMQSSYVQSPVFYSHALSGHPINKVNKKILLPHRRNPFFTGRVETLSSIDAALSNNSNAVITQAQALSGMGGIGKTQTALEFCYRQIANNSYQTILWVNAETEASFNNSYYNVLDLLNLASSSTSTNDGANQALKLDEVISLVKRWLANNHNWLMVLDNLENPKLIKDYLPSNHQGHVLITTRSQSLKGYAAIVQLKKMSSETGTLFLLKRANLIPIDANDLEQLKADNKIDDKLIVDAQKIVQAMDGLPLALEQAGAYIQESGCSLADYFKAYQDARNSVRILDNDGEDANGHASVYVTFKLNFDVVKEKSVAAAKLLEVCSFLDSELIPEEIFTSAGNFLGDELAKLQDNTYEFNNCLKLLLGYSLIERDTNNKSLSIHRLVQTVIRELIGEDNKKLWVDSLAKTLNSLCSNDAEHPKNWPTYQKLLPSVTSLFDFTKLYQSNAVETAGLFHHFGLYCDKQALFAQSLTFYNLVADIYKHHFGDLHPSIASTLNDIANSYNQQGKYQDALDFYIQSLAITKLHFGDNHPYVALTLNNIAIVYKEQGNYPQALDFYYQSLTIYKYPFGDNHPYVADSLNNIAVVYQAQGKYQDSLDFYTQALAIYKLHFGDNHPYVADSLIGIANIYQAESKYQDALDFYTQSLAINKHHFGNLHPSVAQNLLGIANIYGQQGNYPLALDFYTQSLAINKHNFGDNHPSIAQTLNNLAIVYKTQGNYDEALTLYNQALTIYKHHFGDNHPSIAQTLNNIGEVYRQQGNYSDALNFYTQSLAINKHNFGDKHPSVAMTLENLGHLHKAINKEVEAANYYKQALSIYDQIFPLNHPQIVKLLNQYSQLLLKLNKPDEAQPLLDRLASLKQSP